MSSDNNTNTLTQVCAILAPLFDAPIGPEDSTETLPEWDSLRYLEVVGTLENELEVEFTSQELLRLSSVKRIVEIIDAKTNAG
nr:acyl carrier protein [uncultured Pseudodesulfovibrio sp.]